MKTYQTIPGEGEQYPELLSRDDLQSIHQEFSVELSEDGIEKILSALQEYQANIRDKHPKISDIRNEISSLRGSAERLLNDMKAVSTRNSAERLLNEIQNLSMSFSEAAHESKFILPSLMAECNQYMGSYFLFHSEAAHKLRHILPIIMTECDQYLDFYSPSSKWQAKGAPPTALPLKLLIQNIILIFEDETGESFIVLEKSNWGRERNEYNPKAQSIIKRIVERVDPSAKTQEVLKNALRGPLSLDWRRIVRRTISEEIKNDQVR